jgi:UDPglucose--hexose-1-phosphate uridylyltransferase
MAHPTAQDGEIRFDPVMDQWVIMAPQRGRRPKDHTAPENGRKAPPPHDPDCPFCPGNEDRLDGVVAETPGPDGWATRVVANKYPALSPDAPRGRFHEGLYVKTGGYGRHEVVIESPRHDRQPGTMTAAEIEPLVETYHRRYNDLVRMNDKTRVLIFRNHGRRAGTSLVHPHSQIVATEMRPRRVQRHERAARRYYDEKGRCLLCDILEFECRHGRRLLWENEALAAFVPYAADVPYETWIVPRRHQADFGRIDNRVKNALAAALQRTLGGLVRRLDDPDYNYMIHTAGRWQSEAPHLHWYLRIAPRTTTRAGFEIGSGISINPSLPEDDAARLRGD